MATKEQAIIWMKEGKKVYKESDPKHIYYIEDKIYKCLCGEKVSFLGPQNRKQDWEIYKREELRVERIITECPECYSKLDGQHCDICRVKWKFANCEGDENE